MKAHFYSRLLAVIIAVSLLLVSGFAKRAWAESGPRLTGRRAEHVPRIGAAARFLGLKECVRLGIDSSPAVKRARESVRQAELDLSISRSAFMPRLTLGAEQIFYGYDEDSRFTRGKFRKSTYRYDATAEWNLFNSGRDYDAHLRRRLDLDSKRQGLIETIQGEALKIIEAYYSLLSQQEQVRVNEEDLDVRREHLERTNQLFDHGVRSYSDVLSSKIAVGNTELSLITVKRRLHEAQASLNVLVERPSAEPIRIEPEKPVDPGSEEIPDLSKGLSTALENRPEIFKAKFEVKKFRISQRTAAREIFPSVSLEADWTWFESRNSFLRNPRYKVLGLLKWPIFDGFRRLNERHISKSQVNSARAALEDARRSVTDEVIESHLGLEEALASCKVVSLQSALSKEKLELITRRYEAGTASSIEVREAQADWVEFETRKVRALHDYISARAGWRKALGKEVFEGIWPKE